MVEKKKTKIDVDFKSELHGKTKKSFFSSKSKYEEPDNRKELLSKLSVELSGENNSGEERKVAFEDGEFEGIAAKKESKSQKERFKEEDEEEDNEADDNSDADDVESSDEEDDDGMKTNKIERETKSNKFSSKSQPKNITLIDEKSLFKNLNSGSNKENDGEKEFNIWDKVKERDKEFNFTKFKSKKKDSITDSKKDEKVRTEFRSSIIEKNTFETKQTGKKYVLFTGCSCDSAQKSAYDSAKFVFQKLGIELIEPEEFSCCGGTVLDDREHDLTLTLNARNFAIAEKYDADILVLSSTCWRVMNETLFRLESDRGVLENINQILSKVGLTYRAGLKVKHISWVLANEVDKSLFREKIVTPLKDLRIAPFYGCHMKISPELLCEKYEDPENPKCFEEIIAMVGATSVDFDMKMNCCGFHIQANEPKTCYKMSAEILKNIEEAEVDAIVSPSPFCHSVLDACQKKARSYGGVKSKIPIFHLSELVAIAFGSPWKEIGLQNHFVSVKSIMKNYGIPKRASK